MNTAEEQRKQEQRFKTRCTTIEGHLLSGDFPAAESVLRTLIEEETALHGTCLRAEAEWYALLIEYKAKDGDDLIRKNVPFFESDHYAKVLLYADREDNDDLRRSCKKIGDRARVNIEKQELMRREKQAQYDKAMKAAANARSPGAYMEVIDALTALGNFADAPARVREFRAIHQKEAEYRDACIEVDNAATLEELEEIKRKHATIQNYREFGNYVQTAAARIRTRETEATYIDLCNKFNRATKAGHYTALIAKFEALGNYKDAPAFIDQCRAALERLEAERLARERAEEEARNAAREAALRAEAAAFDREVLALKNGFRDKAWCDQVKAQPAKIKDTFQPYVQANALLQDLVREARQLEADIAAEEGRRIATAAAAFEGKITQLKNAPRVANWCTLVERYAAEYAGKTADFQLAAINASSMIEAMKREIPLVRTALQIDEKTRMLESRTVDLAWCNTIMDLQRKVTPQIRPYLTEGEKLKALGETARDRKESLQREENEAREAAAREAAARREAAEKAAEAARQDEAKRRKAEARREGIKSASLFILFPILAILPFLGMAAWSLFRGENAAYWLLFAGIGLVVAVLQRIVVNITPLRVILNILTLAALIVSVCLGQYPLTVTAALFMVIAMLIAVFRYDAFYIPVLEWEIPAVCAAIALGLAFFPSWGPWAMVFIGGLTEVIFIASVIFKWIFLDGEGDEAGTIGLFVAAAFAITGFVFIFITRELAYIALPLLIGNLILAIVSMFGACEVDEDFGLGMGLTIIVITGIALIVSIVWCVSVWGPTPVHIDKENGEISYKLDRSKGTFTVKAYDGITNLMEVRASKAKEIIIEEGYTYIGPYALEHCNDAKVIYLPSGITELQNHAFLGCDALHTVYIGYNPDGTPCDTPSQLEKIGYNLFRSSYSVSTIYYNGTMSDWEAIEKNVSDGLFGDTHWDEGMDDYKIICTDGTIEGKGD